MTCSSLTSVTVRPPTLLVCLRQGSVTLDACRQRRAFAVNLLHAAGRRAAEVFASVPVPQRFRQVEWCRLGSGLPWLAGDALAVAECRLAGGFDVGDHAVLLGQVRRVVSAGAGRVPVLYGRRQFCAWGGTPAADPATAR